MHMPTVTLAAGAALIAIGVGLGSLSEPAPPDASFMATYSKYIPAAFGVALALCGAVAFSPAARKHAIHIALLFAVLGVVGGGARIPKTLAADGSALALTSQLALLLISAAYLAVGIKSFTQARKARKARKQLKAAGLTQPSA